VWDVPIADPEAGKRETVEEVLGVKELKGGQVTGGTGYSSNMAPLVYKGKVIVGTMGVGYGLHLNVRDGDREIHTAVGISGGDHGLRGFLAAYAAPDGRELWRWYTTPHQAWEGAWRTATPDGADLHRDIDAEREAFRKYPNTWRAGGGSVWSSSALDPELGLLYVGTGNPSPQMDDSTRPGDNLHTVSLVALDVETGQLKWHYQQVPHDRWGYDVASPALLLDVTRDGRSIKAVGQAGKTGWFYLHDRRTGELLLRSDPFVPQENMFARPTAEGVRIAPSATGGSSWSPVAFSPQTGAVYISGVHMPARYISRTLAPDANTPWKSYTFFVPVTEERWGTFTAIHASTGRILWQNRTAQPMVGGALATAGGLVFAGEGNGDFDAFDARTGAILWKFRSKAGVNAPPIAYEVDGVQYIAVAAGGNAIFGYPLGDEILVFALP
jgi:alcohol dehydrogenase (cytochrome c)